MFVAGQRNLADSRSVGCSVMFQDNINFNRLNGVMAFVGQESELWTEVNSVSQDEGLRLYDLEKEGNRKLKVTVANLESVREGISIDGCTRICKRLRMLFAAEGAQYGLTEDLELDVSSPGVNRDLRTRDHLNEAVGERVMLKFSDPKGKNQVLVGELKSFKDDSLALLEDGEKEVEEVAYSDLVEARVDFKF